MSAIFAFHPPWETKKMLTALIALLCAALSLVLICWIRYRRRMSITINGKTLNIDSYDALLNSIEKNGDAPFQFLTENSTLIIFKLTEKVMLEPSLNKILRQIAGASSILNALNGCVDKNNASAARLLILENPDVVTESVAKSILNDLQDDVDKMEICEAVYAIYPKLKVPEPDSSTPDF